MPIYVCSDCEWQTSYKDRMLRHRNNKKPCKNQRIYVNSEVMDILNTLNNEISKEDIVMLSNKIREKKKLNMLE